MKSFAQYIKIIENNLNSLHFLGPTSDRASFFAYLDYMEDEGQQIPELLSHWKNRRMNGTETSKSNIRWMIRRDMPEVLMIEKLGTAHPWYENQFNNHLRMQNCISYVADLADDLVAGHMVYMIENNALSLIRLVVHPGAREQGIGRKFIARLKRDLSGLVKSRIVIYDCVPEMANFFSREGFKPIEGSSHAYQFINHVM